MAEFMDFLNKHGVMGLAIAVIIGGAASNLVSSLVGDILMPVITFFIPKGTWREAVLSVGPIQLSIGPFTGALVDFLLIAVIVYFSIKQLAKTGFKKKSLVYTVLCSRAPACKSTIIPHRL